MLTPDKMFENLGPETKAQDLLPQDLVAAKYSGAEHFTVSYWNTVTPDPEATYRLIQKQGPRLPTTHGSILITNGGELLMLMPDLGWTSTRNWKPTTHAVSQKMLDSGALHLVEDKGATNDIG